MNVPTAITEALQALHGSVRVKAMDNLSDGCIHHVLRLTLDDGQALVAKLNSASALPLFEEEAVGLHALGDTKTVIAPKPLYVGAAGGKAVLLMTAIDPATADDRAWRQFGEALAALHQHDAGARYGFPHDNHLGPTPQRNQWSRDWVRFNAEHRLGYQLNLATSNGALSADEAAAVQRVIDRLDRFIPRTPKPSLLHGDLWSGNALPTHDEHGNRRIAVIDPACSIGDGWADIAMMRLFGGFPPVCYDAYRSNIGERAAPADEIDTRIAVYQLYHVLNHVNIFGRSYAGQVLALAHRLT